MAHPDTTEGVFLAAVDAFNTRKIDILGDLIHSDAVLTHLNSTKLEVGGSAVLAYFLWYLENGPKNFGPEDWKFDRDKPRGSEKVSGNSVFGTGTIQRVPICYFFSVAVDPKNANTLRLLHLVSRRSDLAELSTG
jgi:hypothetical protein